VPRFELEDHVKPESWEDIVNRPAHHASVDTRKFRSYRVIGLYAFEGQDASCGASACQKNHNRGFLVVYSSDKETNLGVFQDSCRLKLKFMPPCPSLSPG